MNYKAWINFSSIMSFSLTLLLTACAAPKESRRVIESEKVESAAISYSGVKSSVAVGNFENRSSYLQGLFSNNTDKLGNQARTILKTHLQQSQRFKVLDRANLDLIAQEANLLGQTQSLAGARYTLTGAVTEFGRKETGDKQLFGILGAGKKQIAYSKVSVNVGDVLSSEIIYSAQGAGEYALGTREVFGFGNDASYDATLNGKVLNFAITEVVNTMVRDLDNGVLILEDSH